MDANQIKEIAATQESLFHDKLAEILGYPHDDQYGWVTGDHTAETLLMELERKLPILLCDGNEGRGECKPANCATHPTGTFLQNISA